MYPKKTAAGFTIIELMVGITIMAILLGLAVPAFQDSAVSSRLRASSTDLISSANLARSEAIKRRTPVNMCVAPNNGNTCAAGNWHQGWIVFVPPTASNPTPTVIRKYGPSAEGFRINPSSSITSVTFQPTGVGATAVQFTVCRATPSPGAQERVVTINAAGKVSSRRTTTGTCG
jgi:type IV fimbrial biogenesis protein FimT